MSAQFGRFNFDGRPVDPKDLEQVRPVLAPYGPDGEGYICKDNFGIIYRSLHTTKESRLEHQPFIGALGEAITWDGRLDNRDELLGVLARELSTTSTDVSIVAKSYERWGTNAFARLIGDWAVSIVDPTNRSLILAKDFVGTRSLYYSVEKDRLTWCTILDPLVLFADRSFALEEQYIAGWLSFFPASHLTPYVGIESVPPASFVVVHPTKHTTTKYWDFDPSKRIRYRVDADYEEHFRTVFAEAVRRRLRSDVPVLAELSGGMDSSSIVCIADAVIARGEAETPRLDTVSYYDDSEPNWNEQPYFAKVEEKRARKGCHIGVTSEKLFSLPPSTCRFLVTPSSDCGRRSKARQQFIDLIAAQRNRVVLSGMGGDEVMGGVPTPIPELEDLLARAQFRALARQLKVWALLKRKPWLGLFFETARAFLPLDLIGAPKHRQPAPWLHQDFVYRNRSALRGYDRRLTLFGPLPSFQENIAAFDFLKRQLGCIAIPSGQPCEVRYPYLDRGLLEFVYALPREQLVRPGQRRSLMRRALVGIVPDELLNRKRKAFVARGPMAAISTEWDTIAELSRQMVTTSLGVIDCKSFAETLEKARNGEEVAIVPLMRALEIELWLKALLHHEGLGFTQPPHHPERFVHQCKDGDEVHPHRKILLASN